MTVGTDFGTRTEESYFEVEETSLNGIDGGLSIDKLSIRDTPRSIGAKDNLETSASLPSPVSSKSSPHLHPIEGESTTWTPVAFELEDFQSRFDKMNERLNYGATFVRDSNERVEDADTSDGGEKRGKIGVLLPFVEGKSHHSN